MSLNNLNTYKKPSIDMATMCLASIERGGIDEDCNFRNSSKRTLEWFDLNGKPLNDAQFLELVGIGFPAAERLYYRYKKDCKKIIKHHGYANKRVMTGTRYYDRKGNRVKQVDVKQAEQISHEKLVTFFNNNDYVTAYKLLDEYKAKKRNKK